MQKMKRGMAAALAATMVMGSTFTVFAEDPVTSGSATGAGSSEGHLEKKVTNVVLPTDKDTTTFKYTIDPERLIQGTEGGKYEGFTFPAAESDTGVYFQTDTAKYENTSKKLTVTNQSSHDINLKVTAKAANTNAATDIALAESSTIEGTTPKLYLGLTVGSDTKAVSTTETSITTRVEGKADNFEVKVKEVDGNKTYAYEEKAGATGWKSTDISMTGACNASTVTSALTAPDVTVTWEFEEATGPSISLSTSGVISIANFDGTLYKSMSLNDGTQDWPLVTGTDGTWEWGDAVDAKKEFTLASNWMPSYLAGKTATVTLTLTDNTTITSAPVTFPTN